MNSTEVRANQQHVKRITIKVGSRKSQLALVQTETVIDKLRQFYANNPDQLNEALNHKHHAHTLQVDFEIVPMSTKGDQVLDKPLVAIGGKSLFTKELETALLDRQVDFVVHSLKDLPTQLPNGCAIGAILKRDNPNDTIVLKKSLSAQVDAVDFLLNGHNLIESDKCKVGTSSQRRIALLKKVNPNIECIDIRGNLNTRISKLDQDEGEYAAIILAQAGLDRMGWSDRSSKLLVPEENDHFKDWGYAVGQGALAVECRDNDESIVNFLRPIVDLTTTYESVAERSLMRTLEAGCSVPLAVRSFWTAGRTILSLKSIVLSPDGSEEVIYEDCVDLEAPTGVSINMDLSTTGIITSGKMLNPHLIRSNLRKCAILGVKIAENMTKLGCRRLMKLGN